MNPKFNMTQEQNIFVAKRNIVDYIYKSAKLERLGVTYPDTETIFNGISAPGVKVTDIIAVNNLKRAWRVIISSITPDISAQCRYPSAAPTGSLKCRTRMK